MFNNLIRNAIQSVPDDRRPKVDISIENTPENVTISFTDNGTGIAAEVQERMFQPNFTTKTAGTGLGLAITQKIVEASSGKIWFETQLDEGTTFFVELPVYKV